jgi:hypothetical protein
MRSRLTYANVASTIALFAVIAGGTAVALPGKKTVQANDLKKNSVKAVAIAKGAVGTSEIKDGNVTGADVADGSLGYGDLGSNSVIARIRSTAGVQTGDGGEASPVNIPLSGNQWTQGANEIDVAFGEITYKEPPTCTNGGLDILLLLDGVPVDEDGFGADPNETVTEPFARSRPFVFEPGVDKPRTLTLQAFDSCDNAGEQYSVQSIKVDILGIR